MRPHETYTHGHSEGVLRSHRWRTAENSAAYLLDELAPGSTLLDVGCGPGTITADLAARVRPGAVVGVEDSEAVLAEARAVSLELIVGFLVADVYHLPFPEASFDVVHAHQVLQHLAEPVAALPEMRRVCRPGGTVAARDADYGAMVWHPADPALDEWRRLYRAVARHNRGEPDAGRRLLAWAVQSGFTTIRSSASVWCFAAPDDRTWWGETWAERVTRSAFAEQALAGGHATQTDLAAMAEAFRRWSERDEGWFVVVHGEILCRP